MRGPYVAALCDCSTPVSYTHLDVYKRQANNSAFVEIGEPRLRLLLDTKDLGDYTCIGIARVLEKQPDQRVALVGEYMPPCLDCRTVRTLNLFLVHM